MPTLLPLFQTSSLRRIEAAHATHPLMERAGAAAAVWAMTLVEDRGGPVLVLAGPGNNGGDAFETARVLRQRGFDVYLVCASPSDQHPAAAAQAKARYLAEGGFCLEDIPQGQPWRLIIDGIFGMGLTRAPEGKHAEWIDACYSLKLQLGCPVLALDCPSGINSDTGNKMGAAIAATHTLSFIGAKPGLYTADGPDYSGQARVANLGLNSDELGASDGQLVTPALFRSQLQVRRKNTHKGSFGSVGVAGGAPTMQGAAVLSGRAALKLGAGKVYLGLLDVDSPHLDPLQPELMFRRPAGLMDARLTALACGPGLGGSLEAVQLLEVALASETPLVLDADALSLLAQEANLQNTLIHRTSPAILTPHPGEAARLLDVEVSDVQSDRIAAATLLARDFDCHVVIKGCGSVIAAPDGRWWINPTGNPGMGSAGTGDVLTGFIVSLLAQGWPCESALLAAVHLHGAAADELVASGIGPIGLTASEVIDAARALFNRWVASNY